jgi:ABC-2 type transport system permease protein
MAGSFHLYTRYLGISVQAQMQYRASFVMMSFGQFMISSMEFFALLVLFARFEHIQGWTIHEVSLLYGMANVSFAIADGFFRGFDRFGKYMVKVGEFDRILLRPRSTILQLPGEELLLMRIGRILQGLAALFWGGWHLQLSWTPPALLLVLCAVIGGAALFGGLFVLQATLSFWTTESLEVMNCLTDGGVETAQYPISIYRDWFREFFTYIVPLACINYYPVLVLLQRPDPFGLPIVLQWFAPCSASSSCSSLSSSGISEYVTTDLLEVDQQQGTKLNVLSVKAYASVVSARIRMTLQYRVAALAGIATQLFWGMIRVMIFEAFYRSSTSSQPMTLEDVITYVWLGQALLAFFPWNADPEIGAMVRSGNIVYELTRPLDLYSFWFSRAIANRTGPALLRAAPIFVIAGLFLGFGLPPTFASFAAWLLATLGAILLSCAISNLLNISTLWTISGQGVSVLITASVCILSGQYVPLPFFPDWAQPILNWLPFRGLIDVPFRIYLGHLPPEHVFSLFAHQIAWTAGLIALGKLVLRRGTRRLVVQGG